MISDNTVQGRIAVFYAESNTSTILVSNFTAHSSIIYRLVTLSNGRLGTVSADDTVKIWNTTDWSLITMYTGHRADVYDVRVIDETMPQVVVSISDDLTIQIWNVSASNQTIFTILTGNQMRCIRILPTLNGSSSSSSSSYLLTAAYGGNISVWNHTTGVRVKTLVGHTAQVNDFELMQSNQLLASSSNDQTVIIWNLTSWTIMYKLEGHTNYVYGLKSIDDCCLLASGSLDATIKIWNVSAKEANGSLVETLTGHENSIYKSLELVSFMQEQFLVSGSLDKTIKFWRSNNRELVFTIQANFSIRALTVVNVDYVNGRCVLSTHFFPSYYLIIFKIGKEYES